MKKVLVILILLSDFTFALNLNNFEDRQTILLDIKKVIQKEESIARAYEKYILDNYNIPENINALYSTNYLSETNVKFIEDISNFTSYFTTFTISSNQISYALLDTLKNDTEIKNLYESNTFRTKTYFKNNKINFILEDAFAKHLYDLIKTNNGAITNCPTTVFTTAINCKENNHIYIKLTKKLENSVVVPDKYLIAYHIDKFKTGPIIITDDTSKHITESIFNSIPKGALLYDKNGVKYLKTISSIEVLK